MKQFFSIGEIRYDVILPKEEIINHQKMECVGGIATHCAILLAKWQKNVNLIGSIGKDLYGDMIIDSLVRAKVRTKYIHSFDNCYTKTGYFIGQQFHEFQDERVILKSIMLENRFKKSKNHFFLFDGEEFLCTQEIAKEVNGTKILCVKSYKKEFISLVNLMNYVIVSKDVAILFSGISEQDSKYEAIYRKLKKKVNTNWIILDENDGCFMEIEGKYVHMNIAALGKNIVHLYPAFLASFAYFLSEEKDLLSTLKLAWVTAILATKKPGFRFAIPDLKEVMAYDR